MTENEKARELIATSETTVKVDPQASNIGYSMRNGHYEVTNAIPMDE